MIFDPPCDRIQKVFIIYYRFIFKREAFTDSEFVLFQRWFRIVSKGASNDAFPLKKIFLYVFY